MKGERTGRQTASVAFLLASGELIGRGRRLVRISALTGEKMEIQANPEGHLERAAYDFFRRAGPEPGDLLGQHRVVSGQTMQLCPHTLELAFELLQ